MSIDLDALNELKAIMVDDFTDLIHIFLADGETQIENIRQAINTDNLEDTRRIAHTFKGSSANLGLTDLSERCRQLEHLATKNSLDGAKKIMEQIIGDYKTAKNTLEEKYL